MKRLKELREFLLGAGLLVLLVTLLGSSSRPASAAVSPATVSAFSINAPTEEVTLRGLPRDFETTFTTSASHVLGRYRAIIWMQGPQRVDLAVRTIPLPITGGAPSGPVTQTELITVPPGTPPGVYTLCIRAEENWPPGSESWGYSMTACRANVIRVEGGLIDSIEFTQAIQKLQTLEDLKANGPVARIVKGKEAVMRVYMREVQKATSVRVQVSGSITDSKTIDLVPGCTPEKYRRQQDGCLSSDFYFTPGANVSVAVSVLDMDGNEQDRHTIEFDTVNTIPWPSDPLTVVPVRVCDESEPFLLIFRTWECEDPSSIGGILGFTRSIFPVPWVNAAATGGTVRRATTTGDRDWWSAILDDVDRLRTRAGDRGTQRHWYGVVRDAIPGEILGIGYRPDGTADEPVTNSLSAAGQIDEEEGDTTLAHELGHNRTLMHAPCGDPANVDPNWPDDTNPDARVNEIGFDMATRRVVDGVYYDIMSYCTPHWISVYTYNNLVRQFTAPEGAATAGETLTATSFSSLPVWEVGGWVNPDGTVTLEPIFRNEDGPSTDGDTGDWAVRLVDAAGETLGEHFFEPLAAMSGDFAGPLRFFEMIPVEENAVRLAILDPSGLEQAAVDLVGPDPTVTISSPAGGETWNDVHLVEWSPGDPDDNGLVYRVEYSNDDGATWQTIIDLAEDEGLGVDFSALPGGSLGTSRIRVLASNGVKTGVAVSNGFTVSRKLPTAAIISPMDSEALQPGGLAWFQGVSFDLEDGFLSGEAASWESDLDGFLGNGDNLPLTTLSEGTHTITFAGTDSDGNTASDTVTVVVDGMLPGLSVQIGDEASFQGPGEILVLRTTNISASIETSLRELGLTFTVLATDDFAGVNLDPYDTIIVAMDGGDVGDSDVLALRQALDAGKKLVFFGGNSTADFARAVNDHLVQVDTTMTDWWQPASPHLEVVNPLHLLAQGLPATHDFMTLPGQTRNPSEYMLRVTDPGVSIAARNGDGYPALFSKMDGAMVWFINTPWGAIWGESEDIAILNRLLANSLGVDRILPAPVTVTIDAEDELGGSGLNRVDYSLDGGGTWNDIPLGQIPFSFTITGEGPIHLLARASDRAGNQSVEGRQFSTVADTTPPRWPDGSVLLTSDLDPISVVLTWPAALDEVGVVDYRIYRDGAVTVTVAASDYCANDCSYRITGLQPDTEYVFRVDAGDATGNWAEGPSATVRTLPDTEPPVLTLPSGMTVQATSPAGADFNYTATATDAVDGDVVVTCSPVSGSIFPLGSTTVDCAATDASGNSSNGSFTVTVVDTTPPSWIGGALTASSVTQTSLTLTWPGAADSVGVAGYRVYKDGILLGSVAGTVQSYNVTGLSPGRTYTFKVEAGDAAGNWSSDGPSVTVTTRFSGGSQSPQPPQPPDKQVLAALLPVPPLPDVAGHWAEAAIRALAERGVVHGEPDGNFYPDRPTTRARVIKLLVAALGHAPAEEPVLSFADAAEVPEWARGWLATAVQLGLLEGYTDGTVRAQGTVTREEFAVLLLRAYRLAGVELKLERPVLFSDQDAISPWALRAVLELAHAGVLRGYPDGDFRPGLQALQAEVAHIAWELMQAKGSS